MEMLMHFALFQTRVSEFEDPLEGAYGFKNVVLSDELHEYLETPRDRKIYGYRRNPKPDDPIVEFGPATTEAAIRKARLHTAVTCWYEHDESESYAMWRIYGADSFAVAIETTVGALRSALAASANVAIGGVEYTTLPQKLDTIHELFFHKRPEFATEREIRSVQVFPQVLSGPVHLQALSAQQIDGLLASVIVAPGMRETMRNTLLALIVGLLQGQGLTFDPARFRRSSLDSERLP